MSKGFQSHGGSAASDSASQSEVSAAQVLAEAHAKIEKHLHRVQLLVGVQQLRERLPLELQDEFELLEMIGEEAKIAAETLGFLRAAEDGAQA